MLQCNSTTSIEEVIAFYYRAILCKFRVLFTIWKIEYLSVQAQKKLVEILGERGSNDSKQMKSSLLILYWNKLMDIVEQMRRTKEIKRLQYNHKIITIDGNASFKYFSLIQVVTSELGAGLVNQQLFVINAKN